MKRLVKVLVALTVIACLSGVARAQIRPDDTPFVKARLGFTSFMGDRDQSLFDFGGEGTPFGLGLEGGYQFRGPISLALAYQFGHYPDIAGTPFFIGEEPKRDRHSFQFIGRYLFNGQTSRLAPFAQAGWHLTGGGKQPVTGDSKTAFGPILGAGLDYAVNDRSSVVLEWLSNLSFPDEAVDGVADRGFGSFDVLSFLGVGFKYNFKSAFVPVAVSSVNCPTRLEVGQAGSFAATTNDLEATRPVEYRWDFGDGQNGTGLVASHTFAQPGTYTIRFTGANRGTTSSQTCSIQVVPQPVPAQVVGINAGPTTFEVCEPVTVNFAANVRGDEPVTYTWNFGDGQTATGTNVTHTYSREGTFTATLTVSNPRGTDTESVQIVAQRCSSACQEITELNSVYFDRNSSMLTSEARAALQDNLDILRECPSICVRLEGWAGPDERDAEGLSEDRARVVEQYYVEGGLSERRITARGMGQVRGLTSKKEGANRARRVDTLPTTCRAGGDNF